MTTRPNHNTKPGPITHCQVCGSKNLEVVLDLGHQPLADALLNDKTNGEAEMTYPLCQVWCKDCTLNQLNYLVSGDVVFHPDYHYKTGVTKELVHFQKQMAEAIITDLKIPQGSLVCDVGSNDGTLLKGFKELGMKVQGIEPTNVAKYAVADGIPTMQSVFDQDAARKIVKEHGPAKIATATNVFAHMGTLGDVIEGLEILLADDGYFCLENHYMTAIKAGSQYDTIYHEHPRSYSLHAIVKLFSYYDFTVVEAMETSRYGGNIRCYVAKGKGKKQGESVKKMLENEVKLGITTSKYYEEFREESIALKNDLVALITDLKRQGKTVVGNSFPARASTLLNFAGISKDLMPYIAEQPTSLKLNKFMPGKHIPIVNNQRLIDEQPDYVVLLAWHLAKPIMEQLRARGLKSKFIMPMPKVEVID